MPHINLAQADRIITAALAKGRELELKPLCVAVLDAGGHLIAMRRQDGASTMRPRIAVAKANGALGLGVSSRKIAEMAAERPTFVASLAGLTEGGVVPAAGGVIVANEDVVVGAVGVSGDTSDNDELCALAGVAAAGLATMS